VGRRSRNSIVYAFLSIAEDQSGCHKEFNPDGFEGGVLSSALRTIFYFKAGVPSSGFRVSDPLASPMPIMLLPFLRRSDAEVIPIQIKSERESVPIDRLELIIRNGNVIAIKQVDKSKDAEPNFRCYHQ
jgi:hypothetical protein